MNPTQQQQEYIPPNPANQIITLNVGGSIYTTTMQTLTHSPNTLFVSLLRTLPRDRNGNIFIDRDPIYFRHILDSLRQGEIQHPYPNDSYDISRLWKEIDYFRLLAPGHIWAFSRKKKLRSSAIQVSEDGFYIKKSSKAKPGVASVSSDKALLNGKYRWRIITKGVVGGITFGMVHTKAFKTKMTKATDIRGLSNSGEIFNLERYGAVEDEDDEDDEDDDHDNVKDDDEEENEIQANIKDPQVLMKTEGELGKRVILTDSDDDEPQENQNVKESDQESDNEDILKNVTYDIKPLKNSPKKKEIILKKEERFLIEYDSETGNLKMYKQDEERWYVTKLLIEPDGYSFFVSLENNGDSARIELLQ